MSLIGWHTRAISIPIVKGKRITPYGWITCPITIGIIIYYEFIPNIRSTSLDYTTTVVLSQRITQIIRWFWL